MYQRQGGERVRRQGPTWLGPAGADVTEGDHLDGCTRLPRLDWHSTQARMSIGADARRWVPAAQCAVCMRTPARPVAAWPI